MSTELQKNLAQEIVKNVKNKIPKNKKDLLVSAGYNEVTAKASPERTIKQKGVQKELRNLGFSEEGAKKVVEEIMYDSKVQATARLQATRQVFEVVGSFAPEKHLIIKKLIKIDV